MTYRSDFIGSGNMRGFCEETNKLFAAMNNVVFIMPTGYAGVEPSVKFKDDKIVFDFGNALIFTMENVVWDNGGGSAQVYNGRLHIAPTSL